jgi:D-serine dehydratase
MSNTMDELILDDRIRGVPPGTAGLSANDIAAARWHPAAGAMSLPVLTLDEAAFENNRDVMFRYVRSHGVDLAPHAKTPMSPDLARSLLAAGAWGTTVADIRQASVMLRAGFDRLIVANEVGGLGGARRLAKLLSAWPRADVYVFADSVAAVAALASAWEEHADLLPLKVLPETGAGRAGARTIESIAAVMDTVVATGGRLQLAGIGTYEGSAGRATPAETELAIRTLLKLTSEALVLARGHVDSQSELIVTAGGSAYFDLVVEGLRAALTRDGAARLVLRSGAIFFHDHGIYDRALAALDARQGCGAPVAATARTSFHPALRLWAEVLSRPEPGLAVAGMGTRDVSFDQGFPIAVGLYRNAVRLAAGSGIAVTKLNDQHAFLEVPPTVDLAVGDVLEFGISHPCTCLDRYRIIFGTDAAGCVQHAYPTFFG